MACSASDFITRVAPEVIGVDTLTMENAIQDAIIEFCKESWVLQRGIEFSITADDIGSPNNRVSLDVLELDGLRPDGILALNVGGEDYTAVYREDLTSVSNLSSFHSGDEKFFNFPDVNTINIYPIDGACTIYIRMACVPMRSTTYYPDVIIEDWMDAIAFGAKSRLMAMQRKQWTNGTGARVNEKKFRQEIGKARQMWRKNRSSKSTSVNPRTFGSHL